MTVFGDPRRPWVLVYGVDEGSDLARALKRLAPVVRFIESGKKLDSEVRQSDYDAAVLIGDVTSLEAHLNILQFGGTPQLDHFTYRETHGSATYILVTSNEGLAGQLEVPNEGVPPEAASLARSSLAPWLMEEVPRTIIIEHAYSQSGTIKERAEVVRPFVRERDGAACAGHWPRSGSRDGSAAEHWWLPQGCPDQPEWAEAGFANWRRVDERRFPASSEWLSDPRWMTVGELGALRELAEAEEKLEHETAALTAARNAAAKRLDDARDAASKRERRLITAQAEELKEEVYSAFAELGFTVLDSDEQRSAEGSAELLEDLQIRDADEWAAIAEVRGYSRGAKTSDFQRLARAARSFERRTGREPDARWYVVNHNLSKPPDDRRAVLAGAESDVAEFEVDRGCVIDTRDLFRLRELVRAGSLEQREARQFLRDCRGIFLHPMIAGD